MPRRNPKKKDSAIIPGRKSAGVSAYRQKTVKRYEKHFGNPPPRVRDSFGRYVKVPTATLLRAIDTGTPFDSEKAQERIIKKDLEQVTEAKANAGRKGGKATAENKQKKAAKEREEKDIQTEQAFKKKRQSERQRVKSNKLPISVDSRDAFRFMYENVDLGVRLTVTKGREKIRVSTIQDISKAFKLLRELINNERDAAKKKKLSEVFVITGELDEETESIELDFNNLVKQRK